MNNKIDVLAVMESVADGLRMEGFSGSAEPLEDARAAVAELIEADEQYDAARRRIRMDRDCHVEWMSEELAPLRSLRYGELERAEQRRCAALARVRGAA